MSYIVVNGAGAYSAEIYIPRTGVWRAQLELPLDELLTPKTRVLISIDGGRLTWLGTVKRSGIHNARQVLTVLGGNASMGEIAQARAYRTCTIRTPLTDLLNFGGEVLSDRSHADILNTDLQKWARDERTIGDSLWSLAQTAGDDVLWRVLRDGSTWIGRESWKPNRSEIEILSEDPLSNSFWIRGGVDILPGQTLSDRRVSYVEHYFNASGFRTRVWVEA